MQNSKTSEQLIIDELMAELAKTHQRISDLESLQDELRQSDELFRILFYNSPIGAYIVQDRHFQLCNAQLARLLGCNEEDLLNKSSLSLVLQDDRSTVRENATDMLKGKRSSPYEFRIVTKRAEIKWVTEIVAPVFYQGRRATLGNVIDITERKYVDEKVKLLTLEMQRSNTDLEQFAYVISHDLQEPLRMVSSYTQLLAKRYQNKLDADADEFIAYAAGGAKRMQTLLHDLLKYSRVGTHGKPFSLANGEEIIKQAITNLKVAIEESGGLISYESLPMVMGDEGQLVQLFQNLIANAIKFHRENPPRIYISARRKYGVQIFSVKDNGIGIDPQNYERIFEIFKRLHTEEEYPGTGMGLAICKKIVERHGGHIWVQSQPGSGSTFHFTIRVDEGESHD